ncbi:hypothetical protein GE09DRAFT_1231613 [Coniochaeta sp. 2T2.1]|nr:hypothetical protein GE09DRAFT_1231613 [Coniochaeta sp. 2T2.1]
MDKDFVNYWLRPNDDPEEAPAAQEQNYTQPFLPHNGHMHLSQIPGQIPSEIPNQIAQAPLTGDNLGHPFYTGPDRSHHGQNRPVASPPGNYHTTHRRSRNYSLTEESFHSSIPNQGTTSTQSHQNLDEGPFGPGYAPGPQVPNVNNDAPDHYPQYPYWRVGLGPGSAPPPVHPYVPEPPGYQQQADPMFNQHLNNQSYTESETLPSGQPANYPRNGSRRTHASQHQDPNSFHAGHFQPAAPYHAPQMQTGTQPGIEQ